MHTLSDADRLVFLSKPKKLAKFSVHPFLFVHGTVRAAYLSSYRQVYNVIFNTVSVYFTFTLLTPAVIYYDDLH